MNFYTVFSGIVSFGQIWCLIAGLFEAEWSDMNRKLNVKCRINSTNDSTFVDCSNASLTEIPYKIYTAQYDTSSA